MGRDGNKIKSSWVGIHKLLGFTSNFIQSSPSSISIAQLRGSTLPLTPRRPKHSPLGMAKLIPSTAVLGGRMVHPFRDGEYIYGITNIQTIYTTKFLVCVSVCWTDVMSLCLHSSYSCGTVSPACKVASGQLHVYIVPIHAVWYAMPSGSALRPQAALNQSY